MCFMIFIDIKSKDDLEKKKQLEQLSEYYSKDPIYFHYVDKSTEL